MRLISWNRLFEVFPTQRSALLAVVRCNPHQAGSRPANRVRITIRISDVAWDRSKLRFDYLTESGVPIYTRIVPRSHSVAALI
jgi:hypothetical protein